MDKIIAVLGCGYWGTIVVNTLVSLKLFKTIYICDTDIKKTNILKKNSNKKLNN